MPSRPIISGVYLSLLLAIVVIGGIAVGMDALNFGSSPVVRHSDTIRPNPSNTRSGQSDALALFVESLASARKEGDDLRSQLAQATKQLKSSQVRISLLEAQPKQTLSPADLEKARKQGDELRSQLAQA